MNLTAALILKQAYTRPQLAKLWGLDGIQGINRGVYTPANQRVIFLFVTRIKQSCFTQFNDYLEDDLLFWEGENGHGSDERITVASSKGEEIHLFYRERHHSDFVYNGKVILAHWNKRTDAPSEFVFKVVSLNISDSYLQQQAVADIKTDYKVATETSLNAIDREILTRSRGFAQRLFRGNLFRLWDGACAVTGVREPKVLKASHIKPWTKSEVIEKVDHFNGLLLIPNLDSLFNEGLISFKDDGDVMVSNKLDREDGRRMCITDSLHLKQVFTETKPYLDFHRSMLFNK